MKKFMLSLYHAMMMGRDVRFLSLSFQNTVLTHFFSLKKFSFISVDGGRNIYKIKLKTSFNKRLIRFYQKRRQAKTNKNNSSLWRRLCCHDNQKSNKRTTCKIFFSKILNAV